MSIDVLRYTAFSDRPSGGNPAGIVIEPGELDEASMLGIAANVGYSETAFLWKLDEPGTYRVRYFAPKAEVTFCGHATIAAGVALADHGARGRMRFRTLSGEVAVDVERDVEGHGVATLTSVAPSVGEVQDDILAEALAAFRWAPDDLDIRLPPRTAYAGAHHLLFGLAERGSLAAMDYDFERLRRLMEAQGWTTVSALWQESPSVFHARVPFPVGGVVEDPATGAAAAAFGAYLRALRLVDPPARVTIHQGVDMGRPSRLAVGIDPGHGGIHVSGTAVRLPEDHPL